MTLRQVLNAAYASLAVGRDPDEMKELDAQLEGRAPAKAKRSGGATAARALLAAAALQPPAKPRPSAAS